MHNSLYLTPESLLRLQQLASPILPVGSYSYSEGLELLVETSAISNADTLKDWLIQELKFGSFTIDGAILCRAYRAVESNNWEHLTYWNHWWSAARETHELRQQSWKMGQSLIRLLRSIDPTMKPWLDHLEQPTNWTLVFGAAAAHWNIDLQATLLAYGQSWASNLIGAGVKLIPLGQTAGQQILLELLPTIVTMSDRAMVIPDTELCSCSWGLALASSQHEEQIVRLFQS